MKTFRMRMKAKGVGAKDRAMHLKSRSFQNWFDRSLNGYTVSIDGVMQDVVIQDHNQNNNNDLSDDKYIIAKNDSNIKVGSYIEWDDETWLVFSDEHKTIKTHKQSKVKETNDTIKWIIDGKICNNGNGYRSHVKNQTLYTLGVSTSGHNLWIANSKMMLYLPDNPETRSIKIDRRIFVGDNVYRVMFNDSVSRKGLSNFLLEQDFFDENKDNRELRVADYYALKEDEEETGPETNQKELIIEGSDTLRVGSTGVYRVNIFKDGVKTDEGVQEWSIIDISGASQIVDQESSHISIRIESNFQKVGEIVTIVGRASDGTTGSKTVRLISPY